MAGKTGLAQRGLRDVPERPLGMAEGHCLVFATVNHQGRLAYGPQQLRTHGVHRIVQGTLARRRSAVEAADPIDIFS